MEQLIGAKIDESIQELLKTYELALKFGDEEDANVDNYIKLVEDLVVIKHNATVCDKAIEVSEKETTISSFATVYGNAIKMNSKCDPKIAPEYKKFVNKIKAIKLPVIDKPGPSDTNRVESEDLVMESHISDIDPLTKKRMVNPVRNKVCGHYYEKSTIIEALKINSRLRCPVTACGNKQPIEKSNMIEDKEFKKKLKLLAANNADDDDDNL